MKESFWRSSLREPYRVFFSFAVFSGIVAVGYWFLFGMGYVKTYSGEMHAALQMQVCMGSFIAGFLMTALPKMTSTSSASKFEFLGQFLLTMAMLVSHLAAGKLLAQILYSFWLVMLALFIFKRQRQARLKNQLIFSMPPAEFVWLPAGIIFSLLGVFFTLLSDSFVNLTYLGRQLTNQGLVLCTVIGVGSFMGSRLTGRFRLKKKVINNACEIEKETQGHRGRVYFQLAGALLLFGSFMLEGFGHQQAGYFLRALIVTVYFFYSGVLPKAPKTGNFFSWMLWTSFWLVALGYWGVASHLKYQIESLHVSFLGGLGMMTYAVATMVVVSHGGAPEKARQPLWIFTVVFVGLSCSLGVRLAAVFYTGHYFHLLGFSSAIWVVVGVAWLIFACPYLLNVPDPDIARAHHELMKESVSKS